MTGAFDTLLSRGFFYQTTDEAAVREKLNGSPVTFYVGFDPTADSLHVGHLLPIMAMRWLQKGGHRPIALVGGGTAMVGDPTGRSSSRPMMTTETIQQNADCLKGQLSHFLDFSPDGGAVMVNNGDWLGKIGYIEFLRDIGVCFSINRMLSMDSVKQRFEQQEGISFLEFNYMLLQAYDFYHLRDQMACTFQFGGQDQWGNIIAGIDLVRRKLGQEVYGATFPLLLKSNGEKFGKSAGGAVWLDPKRTSPFEYYQFWRNADDADVRKLLCFFTALPVDEIDRLVAPETANINRAKEILAYEATALAHGTAEAAKAYAAAGQAFGFADPEGKIATSSGITAITAADLQAALPTHEVPTADLGAGIKLVKLMVDAKLCGSTSDARRLVESGGAYVNDIRISDVNHLVTAADLATPIVVKAGKKKQMRIVVK
jgi:tyrosyl-tRNA synthetase